jgi:hypothetical protein
MDYTDCNDFLWPIEIFGLKKEMIDPEKIKRTKPGFTFS